MMPFGILVGDEKRIVSRQYKIINKVINEQNKD